MGVVTTADTCFRMSGLTLKGIRAAENEFLAENYIVNIISHFDHPELKFISGFFGPLISGMPAKVYDVIIIATAYIDYTYSFNSLLTYYFRPLWLAINLRKRDLCTIAIPEWLSVDYLVRSN